MNKTFYIETYGCQMNVVDSEIVTSILIKAGFILVEDIRKANILLLNTCAIREKAVERVVNKMKHHKALKKSGKLEIAGILGCTNCDWDCRYCRDCRDDCTDSNRAFG